MIHLEYNPEDENCKKNMQITRSLQSRSVRHQDDKNRYHEFLGNNLEIEA